jgi:hypothetical protein
MRGACQSQGGGLRRCLPTLLLLLWFSAPAQAQETQSQPVLRIRSPFSAPIWRLDADRAEERVVLSNAGNAGFLWRLQSPETFDVLRIPLRHEQRKPAHAVAISPDGQHVALSVPPLVGATGTLQSGTAIIYIVHLETRRTVAKIRGLPTRPQSLRYSPDGAYLAAALSSGCGVRIWSTSNWNVYAHDSNGYGGGASDQDSCCQGGNVARCDELPDTTSIEFTNDSTTSAWLITSGDTGIRAYRKTDNGIALSAFKRPVEIGLDRPGGVALSPNGRLLAVGDRRNRAIPKPQPDPDLVRFRVAVLETDTLESAGVPLEIGEDALRSLAYLDRRQVPSINQLSLDRVIWIEVADVQYIVAGGGFPCDAARQLTQPRPGRTELCMARWSVGRDPDPVFIPVGTDRIMDLIALPKHDGMLYAGDRRIAAIDIDGNALDLGDGKSLVLPSTVADFRGSRGDRGSRGQDPWFWDFRMSPDGRIVTFDDYSKSYALTFTLYGPAVSEEASAAATITPDQDPNVVRDWENNRGEAPILNGDRLSDADFNKDETFRSVALGQDKRIALLGSSEFLRLLSYAGDKPTELCREPITEEAYRVNITPDGSLAVTAHSDGTLRWYRIHPRDNGCQFELLLSVHILQTAGRQWAWYGWRPSGHFAHHPNAAGLLEWQAIDADGQVIITPFTKLNQWYSRDAIKQALDGVPGDKSFQQVERDRTPATEDIRAAAQRVVLSVLAYPPYNEAATETIRFRLKPDDAIQWPKRLTVRAGFRKEAAARILRDTLYTPESRLDLDSSSLDSDGVLDLKIVLPQSARTMHRQVPVCFFLDDTRQECVDVAWRGELAPLPKRRLRAVLVGLSKYDSTSLNLPFAENDAIDLARLFIADYRNRIELKRSRTPPDYYDLEIFLVVSPLSPAAAGELEELSKLAKVTRLPASRNGIVAALQRIADTAKTEDISNDLLLFYFSGHGVIHPEIRKTGRTVFAMPETSGEFSSANLDRTGLSSGVLLDLLRSIPGQKLLIFDACRTPARVRMAAPFDPSLLASEFKSDEALVADTLFSSSAGQESIERPEFAFDQSRPESDRGNGLFTRALLDALTDPKTGWHGASPLPQIGVDQLFVALSWYLDATNTFSPGYRFKEQLKLDTIPTPSWVRYDGELPTRVIRTYEMEAR